MNRREVEMIGIPREQYLTESTLPAVQELSLQNGIFRIADGSRFVLRGALEESSAAALAAERIRQYWNCEGSIAVLARKTQKNLIRRFSNRNNRNFCQKDIDRGSLINMEKSVTCFLLKIRTIYSRT